MANPDFEKWAKSYSGCDGGDIGTIKAAHWASGYTLPQGDALLAGFYANELLLKLLPRQDPQPELFDS